MEKHEEKVEKIINKYFINMQLQMQRFANEITELKFNTQTLKEGNKLNLGGS